MLFGFLEQAAWIISDSEGGQLPACETDVDLPSNGALARIPPDSSIRLEVWGVWTATGSMGRRRATTTVYARLVLSQPSPTVTGMKRTESDWDLAP